MPPDMHCPRWVISAPVGNCRSHDSGCAGPVRQGERREQTARSKAITRWGTSYAYSEVLCAMMSATRIVSNGSMTLWGMPIRRYMLGMDHAFRRRQQV